jgi:plasmid stabilization system protein ParE
MSDKPLEFHTAAHKFVDEIDDGIESIRNAPNRWPILEPNARRFLLKRFPFAIIYREKSTKIQVIAFAHGHRRPGYWRTRR